MSFQRKWKNPSGTKCYYAWRSMRDRCLNKKSPAFRHYGGRGITVCDEWRNDYDKFFQDMGEPSDGQTLDRIDNDIGYSKSNCRWATMTTQQNNKRNNRIITHNGESKTLSQWAKESGLKKDALWRRLNIYKIPLNRALDPKKIHDWKHGTRQGYEFHKCKCDLCRESNNRRHRERRAKKKLLIAKK